MPKTHLESPRRSTPPFVLALLFLLAFVGNGAPLHAETSAIEEEVRAAETAFAAAFAARDLEAFASFIGEDAVFAGGNRSLKGREEIVEVWSRFFAGETPPFSWKPTTVLVAPSGLLGATTGPVLDPDGRHVGSFASTWEKRDGRWQVIFDVSPACPPVSPPEAPDSGSASTSPDSR